jgi:hypothetical protein
MIDTLMKKPLYLVLLTILISLNHSPAQDLTKTIATRFTKIWFHAPQEKVYLHTDKTYYSAGEDIWFSAHLVNAATHKPDTRSRFVYVELIDRVDSVLTRIKLKRDDAGIAGKISIPAELAADEYVLRAYTYWMQNAGPDFFFYKKIMIGNQIDDRIKMDYSFGTPANGTIPLTLTFTNTFGFPVSEKPVIVNQAKIRRRAGSKITDKSGKISIEIPYDSILRSRSNIIEVSMTQPGLRFKRKITLPDATGNFDIQFLPESGVLLDDQLQTIGFKAIGNNGLAVEVEGRIFNNQGEELSSFRSIHKGMGKLILRTFPGETYYALVKSAGGFEKKVQLPATSSNGIVLHITSNRGRSYYQLLNQSPLPNDSLYLMIHSRGVVYLVLPLNQAEGQFSESFLPSGICSFSVIDSVGNTYCERLHFIRNFSLPSVEMQTNKSTYGKREAVELSFNLRKPDQSPLAGIFSLSVTDNKLVQRDSINDNILTYLLLSSDLKGFIEEPQEYFKDNSAATREKTDALMLTQGWRRFNTADLVKARYPNNEFYMEIGQTVSGKVLNLFNKPAKNNDIILLSGYKNYISTTKTDTAGQFLFDGFEFPDSTNIILKAKSKAKIVDVEIIPDRDRFPLSYNKLTMQPTRPDKLVSDEYLQHSKEKYYTEGGMMVVNLDEFTVSAEAKTTSNDFYYSGMADHQFSGEKLEEMTGLQIFDIISRFPGVQVNGDEVSIRGGGTPLFVIDGIETSEVEDVKYLNVSDIEDISLFRGPSASIFGSRGGNGVIAIALKKGAVNQQPTPPSLAHILPLGFQKPAIFYVPKYETDSILNSNTPDLRTTIYWQPSVMPDEQGNVRVQFFTADKANHYQVELEGVGKDGDICRFTAILRRE